jgi:hypothetical protein
MRQPRLMDTSGDNWLDLSWPSLAIIAGFVGLIVATQTSYKKFEDSIEKVWNTVTKGRGQVTAETDWALVITANPAQQLQVVATLSPRGLEPLLAENLQQVERQLAAHPNAVRLGVVDATLRDAAAIVRALRASLPASRIVVIERSRQRETIGPLLLDRL